MLVQSRRNLLRTERDAPVKREGSGFESGTNDDAREAGRAEHGLVIAGSQS